MTALSLLLWVAAAIACPSDGDLDGDGVASLYCGGEDCNDGDSTVYPDAEEIVGDGLDQDCDGQDEASSGLWLAGGSGTCATGQTTASVASLLTLLAVIGRRR